MNTEKSSNYLWLKIILPPLILVFAVVAVVAMFKLKPEQEKKEPQKVVPTVKYLEVLPEELHLTVRSQGTVDAQTQTNLTAKVSGVINYISPSLRNGASFKKDELLLKIDDIQYQATVAEAKAALSRTQLAFEQELANSEQAKIDWESINGEQPAPALVLRQPQLEKAKAEVEAAKAQLALAQRNLSYTEVRAPYEGRILEKYVDLGQSVSAQASRIADIYALDAVEIELPIEMSDFRFIGLSQRSEVENSHEPITVSLTGSQGSLKTEWTGKITRLGGNIDRTTRMGFVVATVTEPHLKSPPLQPGMYVEAEIFGNVLNEGYRIPRGALQPDNSFYLINEENRLNKIQASIVKMDADWVIIDSGVNPNDRICLTPLLFFVEGMEVNPVGSTD